MFCFACCQNLQKKCTEQLSQGAAENKKLEESNKRNEQALVDKIREATDMQTYNRQLQNDREKEKVRFLLCIGLCSVYWIISDITTSLVYLSNVYPIFQ